MAKYKIDHDLHIHTNLSTCAKDENLTIKNICNYARKNNYSQICITNHLWDNEIEGASNFYIPQDIEHIKSILPLPKYDDLEVFFGAEIEFPASEVIPLRKEKFDLFDFVLIPINHFHQGKFITKNKLKSFEEYNELFLERLEKLITFDLPWNKIGIPHLIAALSYNRCELNLVRIGTEKLDFKRMKKIFDFFGNNKVAIEINLHSLGAVYLNEKGNVYSIFIDFFEMALKSGCKIYFASDAHALDELPYDNDIVNKFIEQLNIKESDIYRLKK